MTAKQKIPTSHSTRMKQLQSLLAFKDKYDWTMKMKPSGPFIQVRSLASKELYLDEPVQNLCEWARMYLALDVTSDMKKKLFNLSKAN